MRGKREFAKLGLEYRGITPADAGKTNAYLLGKLFRWDHPRGCGENCCYASGQYQQAGSPPRMRGKHSSLPLSVSVT